MDATSTESLRIGKKISRLRKIRGLSQEELAARLQVSRQTIVNYEGLDSLDESKLAQVAQALGISLDALKNFDEEAAINNVGNTFTEGSSLINYNFNPVEKIIELTEKLLLAEKARYELLEQMLRSEQEKSQVLAALLNRQP